MKMKRELTPKTAQQITKYIESFQLYRYIFLLQRHYTMNEDMQIQHRNLTY